MPAQEKMAGNVLENNVYMDGEYLEKNPTWFVEGSLFKVRYILQMIGKKSFGSEDDLRSRLWRWRSPELT